VSAPLFKAGTAKCPIIMSRRRFRFPL
jgi:hypothetical protein